MLVLRQLQQPSAQHLHRSRLVLQLAALVLHRHDDPGGPVGDAHRRVGGVHALTAGAAAAVDVDVQVALVDLDVDLVGLGQHQHRGRRRVDAALALGDRHTLHAVRPTLELEVAPRRVAAHDHRHLVEAAEVARIAGQHLELPALLVRERLVHLEQVTGEQVGLLATLGTADLDDDGATVVRILRQHQRADLVLERSDLGLDRGQLGTPQLALVTGGRVDQLAGGIEIGLPGAVPPERLDQRRHVLVPLRRSPQPRGVGQELGVAQTGLEQGVLVVDPRQPLDHRGPSGRDTDEVRRDAHQRSQTMLDVEHVTRRGPR